MHRVTLVLFVVLQSQRSLAASESCLAEPPREYWTDLERQTALYFFQRSVQIDLRSWDSETAHRLVDENGTNKSTNGKNKFTNGTNKSEGVWTKAGKTLSKTSTESKVSSKSGYLMNEPGNTTHENGTKTEFTSNETEKSIVTKGGLGDGDSELAAPDSSIPYSQTREKSVNKTVQAVGNGTNKTAINETNTAATNETSTAFAKRKDSRKETEKRTATSSSNGTLVHTQKITEKTTIEVATPFEILTAYICLFAPLGVAWSVYFHLGSQEKHALLLLPITMVAMSVGQDLVNQSLAIVMEVPASITAVQAIFMGLMCLSWTVAFDRESVKEVARNSWLFWVLVSFTYSLYQLVNHQAYQQCSLSERTVFLNLCPIAAMVLERIVLPVSLVKPTTFKTRLALICMVVGAVLFSIQFPDFSVLGLMVATLLVLTLVPMRLLERTFIGNPESWSFPPISALAGIDGIMAFLVSVGFSTSELTHATQMTGRDFHSLLKDFSVLLLLILSIVTFIGGHVSSLLLLRKTAATTVLVYQNIVGFVDVALGVAWFGDQVFRKPMVVVGLGLSLACGLWYSAEAAIMDLEEEDAAVKRKDSENQTDATGSSSAPTNEG